MNIWKDHGTKVLGSLMTLLGVFSTLDGATMASIFGEKAQSIAVIIGGLLTILRGFQNTSKSQDPKP